MLPSASLLYCPIHPVLSPTRARNCFAAPKSSCIRCPQEKGLPYGQQRQPSFHSHQQADASTSSWKWLRLSMIHWGPGEEGSSPIPGILDLVDGKRILSLAMAIHRIMIWVPWQCLCIILILLFLPKLPKSVLWGTPQPYKAIQCCDLMNHSEIFPSLTAYIKSVPGSWWFFNFIFPNPPPPFQPCQPCSLSGFHHYLVNY